MTFLESFGELLDSLWSSHRDLITWIGVGLLVFAGMIWVLTGKWTMLSQPFLAGVFNQTLLGIPAYIYVMGILIVLGIIIEIAMQFMYWKPFEMMWGIYDAYWNKSNAVFVGDIRNRYQLIDERRAKLIDYHSEYIKLYDDFFEHWIRPQFDSTLKLQVMWAKLWRYKMGRSYDMEVAKMLEPGIPEKGVVNAGGIEIDLIFDFDSRTYLDSPQRREVIRAKDMWNELHPEDEIFSQYKFQKYLREGKLNGIVDLSIVHPTVTIPWTRIKAAFPVAESKADYSGYEMQRAKDMEDEGAGDFNKFAYLVVGLTVLLVIMLFAMRAMHFIGHLPASP